MCFVLKECGTFIGGREDLPTNCSGIKKRQILDETERIEQRRWQKMVVIAVWLERKLGGNGGRGNWNSKMDGDCEGFCVSS